MYSEVLKIINQIVNFISSNWIEWLFLSFAAFSGWGYRRIIKTINANRAEDEALREGVQALLRDRIIHIYDKYTKLEYCPIYVKESVKRMYKPYHALGGNDVATNMVETLIEMPTSKHEEEKKEKS